MSPYVIPGIAKTIADISADEILRRTCTFYEVNQQKLFEPTRKKQVVLARHSAMWILSKYRNMGCVAVSRIFKKDHTTVIHAVQSIDDRLQVDIDFSLDIKKLLRSIKVGVVGYGPKATEEVLQVPKVKQIIRPAAEYSNTSPFRIASGNGAT